MDVGKEGAPERVQSKHRSVAHDDQQCLCSGDGDCGERLGLISKDRLFELTVEPPVVGDEPKCVSQVKLDLVCAASDGRYDDDFAFLA